MDGIALIKVVTMDQKKDDKNGLKPVLLIPVAGECPSFRSFSGTIAQSRGFFDGYTYLATYNETPANEYGRQFNWTSIMEVTSPIDVLKLQKELGKARIIEVGGDTPIISQIDPAAAAQKLLDDAKAEADRIKAEGEKIAEEA